jgi:hypothetical protein
MRRLIILATGLLVGLTAPVWAAGQFDGEWTGWLMGHSDGEGYSREDFGCGFDKHIVKIFVVDDKFLSITEDEDVIKREFYGIIKKTEL